MSRPAITIADFGSAANVTGASTLEHKEPRQDSYGFDPGEFWLKSNDENLLWLPPEFKPSCSAVSGSVAAIGCHSGRVLVISFSLGEDSGENDLIDDEEALRSGNINILRHLLRRQFDLVTCDEYSWLRELDDIGYSCEEIADLLFEQANDTPWIYFKPETFDVVEVRSGVHLPGCVHGLFSSYQSSPDQYVVPLPSIQPKDSRDITRVTQELCGLAGVTPISRDLEEWNGFVRFEQQNCVAAISYSQFADSKFPEHRKILSRIANTLERFCNATGRVQTPGLCCDSFTI
jgi:hypothetical protein